MPGLTSWKSEKQRFLSLYGTLEGNKDWIKWQNIKTWKQYVEKGQLPEAAKLLPAYRIDISKNRVLADKVSIHFGNITKLQVDAIVNATNFALRPGGGVNGAINKAAGKYLIKECFALHGCKTGEVKLTGGYKLPAKYVIQAVGPIGENAALLANCYTNSLKLAMENKIRTIVFPCISTKTKGYPNVAAAHVASYAVRKFLEVHHNNFDRVIFCVFIDTDKTIYEQVLQTYFPSV